MIRFDQATLYELHYLMITLGKVGRGGLALLASTLVHLPATIWPLTRFTQAPGCAWTTVPNRVAHPQVFCAKRRPACGSCPLAQDCDYAKNNGEGSCGARVYACSLQGPVQAPGHAAVRLCAHPMPIARPLP